ncbi:MAG: oligosaccharide flippase family protein [Candidatus Micrarchaeia archaeon]
MPKNKYTLQILLYYYKMVLMAITKKASIGSDAGKSLSILYLGQILGALITVLTFVYLTRFLGPSNYGIYTFAIGFITLVSAVGNFGIGTYMSRNLSIFSHNNNVRGINETISSSYVLVLIVAFILTVIALILSNFVPKIFSLNISISYLTLAIASLIIFFQMIQNVTVHALVGFSSTKQAAITSVSVDVIQLISIILLLSLSFGVDGAVIGILIGNIIGSIVAVYFMISKARKEPNFKIIKPTKAMLSNAFNFSLPLAINNVLNTAVQNFSILFLGFYVASAILGNYGAAIKGLNFAAISYGTMSIVILPLFSRASADKNGNKSKAYTKALLYALVITLPFIIFVSAMAQPAVYILISSKYLQAPLYLSLITFGMALNMFAYYSGSLLASEGFTKKMLKYNLVSIIVQLALIFLLTPILGVFGVIIPVFIIGGILNSLLMYLALTKNIKTKISYSKIILSFISALLLYIPLSLVLLIKSSILELILGAILLIITYPIFIILFRVIEMSDLDKIKSITPNLPLFTTIFNFIIKYTVLLHIKINGKRKTNGE